MWFLFFCFSHILCSVSFLFSPFFLLTSTGVTNVLYCALQGLINPGDEVVLLEPYFDIYASQVKLAGGIPIFCPLRSDVSKLENGQAVGASEFYTLDLEELASKITSNTKVMILNSPHNPTGKIFNRKELEGIANIVKNYSNLIVLSDEVYQHIIFDPKKEPHISIATVNDGQIWDQTLTMSSAGKTFACTGWKVSAKYLFQISLIIHIEYTHSCDIQVFHCVVAFLYTIFVHRLVGR